MFRSHNMPKYSVKDQRVQTLVCIFEKVLIQNGATSKEMAIDRCLAKKLLKEASNMADSGLLDHALSNCNLCNKNIKRIIQGGELNRAKYEYFFDPPGEEEETQTPAAVHAAVPENGVTLHAAKEASSDNLLRYLFRKMHKDTRHDIALYSLNWGKSAEETSVWMLRGNLVTTIKVNISEMESVFNLGGFIDFKFTHYPFLVNPTFLPEMFVTDFNEKGAPFGALVRIVMPWSGYVAYVYIDLEHMGGERSFLIKARGEERYVLAII